MLLMETLGRKLLQPLIVMLLLGIILQLEMPVMSLQLLLEFILLV